MKRLLIRNVTVVNEGERFEGSVWVEGEKIAGVCRDGIFPETEFFEGEIVDGRGKWLIPGVIDDQVHFRDPGLTHKGDIATESAAAVAGGVTSYLEMPNTCPQTTDTDALNRKFDRAAAVSHANYSFYLGATNDNLEVLKKADTTRACGVKVFMGSSTGHMLVDNPRTLAGIFAEVPLLVAVHCEKEEIIRANTEKYKKMYGEELPVAFHPLIRSEEACYASSAEAVGLAVRYGTRLHLLHLSTAREIGLLEDGPLREKKITGEVCVHHLYFDDGDYEKLGNRIKWNPAVKTRADRLALMEAVRGNRLDVIATDHAPHLPAEKQGSCLKAASGGPLVQHSLQVMIEKSLQGEITLEKVVEKMCHAPAELFGIEKRGYIRKGYYADLVLIDPRRSYRVTPENILSKCGWSPFEGHEFSSAVERTYVNGRLAYADGRVDPEVRGMELTFTGRKTCGK